MPTYKIRFVHKIASSSKEYHDRTVEVPEGATGADVAKILRSCGAMLKGQRLREFRREQGKLIAFPACWRGITTTWHAIVLEAQP